MMFVDNMYTQIKFRLPYDERQAILDYILHSTNHDFILLFSIAAGCHFVGLAVESRSQVLGRHSDSRTAVAGLTVALMLCRMAHSSILLSQQVGKQLKDEFTG